MCCRRPGQPRRQPLVLALGKFAYSKYRERKALQQQQQTHMPSISSTPRNEKLQRRASPPPHVLEQGANNEILEKAGIAPPSYDDAIRPRPDLKTAVAESSPASYSSASDDDLSDSDSLLELDDEAQAEVVRSWKESRGPGGELEGEEKPQLTKWQQRRAERMQRKAEKAARKAGRAAMGL